MKYNSITESELKGEVDYYNRHFDRFNLKNMKYINKGLCAEIYSDDEQIFKKYFPLTPRTYRLKENVFDILKDINNPHFIELYEIYNRSNQIDSYKSICDEHEFIVSAYTAKYYKDNSVNALLEDKNYLLENFCELEKLFEELTKNNICTNDVKRDNSILGKNGIVIIDPDLFYLVESSDAFLRQINKKNLFNLYNSIIINSLEDDIYYQKNANIIRALLESIKITEKTDVTHEISKTLKYVNKPKELFK